MDPEIYQILTCSTTCCMWRVEKVWRAGEEIKFWFCRVPIKNTRQTYNFAECWKKNTRQSSTFANGRHAVRRPSHMPVT